MSQVSDFRASETPPPGSSPASRSSQRAILRELLAPIASPLAAVEKRLAQELRSDEPFIDELARHSYHMGGKRLRPALLLLAAEATGGIREEHLTLAAVVEMVHTATLVHDDVLDEAEVRRHVDTVNARWNNQTSVLLGDYLFSHAFYLASTLETTFGCRAIGQATNTVCEGELLQTSRAGDFWLSRDDYFKIIEAKTARLCACCCQLGAHYGGAPESTVARLESFGRDLGIAFQIADDLLDLVGEEQTVGKSLGTDLANRKMTLPLIHLRDQLDRQAGQRLEAAYTSGATPSHDSESAAGVIAWLEEAGSIEHARQTAMQYAEQAIDHLRDLPQNKALGILAALAQFTVHRRL
jgi:octaprenyl-diphosphate synthase